MDFSFTIAQHRISKTRATMSETAYEDLPDGVYFDLDKDRYHNDHALGSTDIRNLMISPPTYWWSSWMNPMHVPTTTKWMTWGSAFDVLITEGREAFLKRYYRGPAKADYDGLLEVMDDMKKWLDQRGLAVSGNKDKLIERILNTDPDAPIWDKIVEREQIKAGDRVVLDPTTFDSVSLSSHMITKSPSCASAFTNGHAQVSVVWTDGFGVRLKARFDYLRYKAVVELKSFTSWRQMPIMRSIFNAIGAYRLDIQAAHYMNARSQIPALVKAGAVFGKVDKLWLDRMVEQTKEATFVWIFYQGSQGAPIAKRIDYEPAALYHDTAMVEINLALEKFRRNREVFGEEIWVDLSDPHRLATEDLPAYLGIGA